jgi:hypothetical protein
VTAYNLAAVLSVLLCTAAQAQTEAPQVLVMPFENSQNEQSLLWLSEGAAIVLAEFLPHYGRAAIAREERTLAFERLQLPPAVDLSHATVIKVGQFVGASEVVIGSYAFTDDQLTLRARMISLDAGRLEEEVVEQGKLDDLFGIFDRLARRLRGSTTTAPPPAAQTLLTSPRAFELYVKGLVAESLIAQQTYLDQAAKAAPADDRVRLALWHVHMEAGRPADAITAVAAVPRASPHSR